MQIGSCQLSIRQQWVSKVSQQLLCRFVLFRQYKDKIQTSLHSNYKKNSINELLTNCKDSLNFSLMLVQQSRVIIFRYGHRIPQQAKIVYGLKLILLFCRRKTVRPESKLLRFTQLLSGSCARMYRYLFLNGKILRMILL